MALFRCPLEPETEPIANVDCHYYILICTSIASVAIGHARLIVKSSVFIADIVCEADSVAVTPAILSVLFH